ncbi:MAG: hypothetical protein AB1750_07390 [Chloroflexota bacterium]
MGRTRISPRLTPYIWLTSLLVAGAALLSATLAGSAQSNPPGPDRFQITTVQYTAYEWLLVTFKGNHVVCKITVDYEGRPTLEDVYIDCGDEITNKWLAQKPCLDPSKANKCDGVYIYFLGSHPAEKEVTVELPAASAWLNLEGCVAVSSLFTNLCETLPALIVTGQEPLSDYAITQIEVRLNGKTYACQGDTCAVPLEPTSDKGVLVEFWAYSSYGDSSEKYTGTVRVVENNFGNPDDVSWYVDVLSSQWTGQPLASCAQSWGVLPPVGGPPAWLATPNEASELATHIPYNYLAANLIRQNVVDVSACSDGGLNPDRLTASQCGLTAAREAVDDWQNRFDDLILSVAQQTGVPAQLLKNLFARESQFWPGVILTGGDTGLGQLTDKGADTTLMWNPIFYHQFCPLILSSEVCATDYMDLEPGQQELLRGALVRSVNANCAECPLGIDLERADFSITVFAHTLSANCEQTSQVVWNYNNRKMPGELGISYEDMWKFTLVNYNAGGGCLASAMENALAKKEPLTWDRVSLYLEPACQGAFDYVNDISK